MELVVDANILFAALIKDGLTRQILLLRTPFPLTLFTTAFIKEETVKHLGYLASKTKSTESEILTAFTELLFTAKVVIIPEDEIRPYFAEALKLSPDEYDMQYFAVALFKKCPIWSNDSRLAKQSKVQVVNTKEILAILG